VLPLMGDELFSCPERAFCCTGVAQRRRGDTPADGGHEAGAQPRWNPARADPLSQRFDAHPVRVGDQQVPVGDVDPGGIVVVGLGSDDHPAG